MKYFFFIPLLVCTFSFAHAQDDILLETDTVPNLKVQLEKKADKKALTPKNKKNVYYGVKTRKTFITSSNGKIVEIFNYMPEFTEPVNPYIDDIGWYYPEKKSIYYTEASRIRKPFGLILHGPYKKMRGSEVIEEGFFYFGTRHGRWMEYGKDELDKDIVLKDKTKYFRGWLKDSERSYYDVEQKKLKEAIPVKHGERNGTYYAYYENGNLKEKGVYEHNVKIGIWIEYYSNGSKKRETRHGKDSTDKAKPFVMREWDERGNRTEYKE